MIKPQKPYFHLNLPVKETIEYRQVSVKSYGDGDIILETDQKRYVLTLDLNYDGCYYESDRPSTMATITEYDKIPFNDEEFTARKRAYSRAKLKFKKDCIQYEKDLVEYEASLQRTKEIAERRLFLKLKKKFEKK